jgi:hypothetical protein
LNDLIVGARGKLKAGKFYVIFGKKDNTTIDLSAIASGTGGFVINGENVSGFSGISVSTAGATNIIHILTVNNKSPCATGNSR